MKMRFMTLEERLDNLVGDYTTKKQPSLIQMKKGIITKKAFLEEAQIHIMNYYDVDPNEAQELLKAFEHYPSLGFSTLFFES